MSEAPELKPCPFCACEMMNVCESGTRHAGWEFTVECLNCGADGPYASTPQKASATWNTRADLSAALVGAAYEAAIKRIDGSRIFQIREAGDDDYEDGLSEAQAVLRALAPDDARAAFDAAISAARRDALMEAADKVRGYKRHGVLMTAGEQQPDDAADVILALAAKHGGQG